MSATRAAVLVGIFVSGCASAGGAVDPSDCLKARFEEGKHEIVVTSADGDARRLRRTLKRARIPCVAQLQIDSACLIRVAPREDKKETAESIASGLQLNIFERRGDIAPPGVQETIGRVFVNFEIPGAPFVSGPFGKPIPTTDSKETDPLLGDEVELAALGADAAWFDAQESKVLIAVIDGGVNYKHPDLIDRFEKGVTVGCPRGPCDGSPYGLDGGPAHGTEVAGIILASRFNRHGGAGVAWNTRFVSINYGPMKDEFRMSCALQKAIEWQVAIVNGSWTEIRDNDHPIKKPWKLFEKYVRRAQEDGILLVLAAGNHKKDVDQWPLNPLRLKAPNMLGVMSFDVTKDALTTDNIGRSTTHIAAPDYAHATTCTGSQCPDGYSTSDGSGTSWSAAYVSGAAALLKSHYPKSDYDFLKWRIMANAKPDERLRALNASGGRLNLVSTIFPVVSQYGDLSRDHETPVNWKTGLRVDMCAKVSIQARSIDGEKKGAWFTIFSETPNDGLENIPSTALAELTDDRVQIRVQCPDEILGADSLPIPLH